MLYLEAWRHAIRIGGAGKAVTAAGVDKTETAGVA